MKKGLISGLFIGLFLISMIGVVSAATSCGDNNKIIMRLYQNNNSHGALWNGSDLYTEEICYSGTAPANPHDCDDPINPTNAVLWLNAENNSHASITKITGSYETPVCYGDLTCDYSFVDATGCTGWGGEIIASLYQTTNSHMSAGDDSNYPTKICCKSSVGISGAFWRDGNNTIINKTDLNDLVRLSVSGVGLEGQNIEYEVWRSVKWWWDSKISTSSSEEFTTWRANQSGKYYFKVRIEGDQTWAVNTEEDNIEPYKYLNVSDTEINSNPDAIITGPLDRQMYFLGTDLYFDHASYDVDDEFTYTWDLGDGRTFTGDSITKANWNFSKSFDTPGQKDIVLTVEDGRGGVGRDQISVLILNSSFVLAYISSPQWGQSYGRTIEFDASGTYSSGYDSSTEKVTCYAGTCPATTQNCPLGSPEGCTTVAVDDWDNDFSQMIFDWIFINGVTQNEKPASSGNSPYINWSFGTASRAQSPHKAKLNARYTG